MASASQPGYPISTLGVDAKTKRMIAKINNTWHNIACVGHQAFFPTKLKIDTAESPSISEYNIATCEFTTKTATFKRISNKAIQVSGATSFKGINGQYAKTQYDNCYQNNVHRDIWYLKSQAGQWVFATTHNFSTKVLAMHDSFRPYELNATADNNELCTIFDAGSLTGYKRLINIQRYHNIMPAKAPALPRSNSPKKVHFTGCTLTVISNENAGRSNRSFIMPMSAACSSE